MNPLLGRVSVDPDFFFGKPHIRGQRIWVSTILDLIAGGMSVAEVLKAYPTIEELDIYAAIAYGAEMSRDRPIVAPDVLRAGPQCRHRRPASAETPSAAGARTAV